jgi:hypothetical protein
MGKLGMLNRIVIFAAVVGLALASVVLAQPPAGAPGGGGQASLTVIFGTVAEVDAGNNMIRVTGQNNQEVWVTLTDKTTLTRHAPASAADLALAQAIKVNGQMAMVTANDVTLGDESVPSVPGLPGAPTPPLVNAGGPAPGAPAPTATATQPLVVNAHLNGKVAGIEPLAVTADDGTVVGVTLLPTTKLSQIMRATLDDVQVGGSLLAIGQRAPDGSLTALYVRLGEIEMLAPAQ